MNTNVILSIIDKNVPLISNLSNVASAINLNMQNINWVGFYFVGDNELYLGPFQGEPACTIIRLDKGICGRCFREQKTIIVDNVLEEKEHIACSSKSRSEIVVPIFKDDKVVLLLDIDAPIFNRFNEEDRNELEVICKSIEELL